MLHIFYPSRPKTEIFLDFTVAEQLYPMNPADQAYRGTVDRSQPLFYFVYQEKMILTVKLAPKRKRGF